MSNDLKKYVMLVEGKEGTENVINESDYEVQSLLDELESHLSDAVEVAYKLERNQVIGSTVGAYTRPWLQAWIDDTRQSGSVASLRESLALHAEEENGYDDDDDDGYIIPDEDA